MPRRAFALALLLSLPAAAQPADHLSFALQTRPLRGLQGPIATLLTTGQEGGGLPMAALAVPSGESDGKGRFSVPLLVEIEGNGLLSGSRKEVQRLEIYAYAMGPDGAVNDYLAQGLSLDLAQVGEAVLDSGIKFVGMVTMPAGAGSLRVLVVEPDTLRYSLRVLPLTVPSALAGPVLLPPLFSDPRGRWVLARPAESEGLESSLAPLLVDEGWGLPASLPLLAGGRTRRVALLGRDLPARLGDMEAGLYRQSPQSAEALREIELETAQRLGKGDPEVLLPLALLHAELYRSLRERKELYLAESARRTSADLAAAYAERGGSGSVAAQALLSLAADLLASGVQSASRSMLDRALALDGRNEAVGLFLAASAERDGDYPRAVEVLERLVQAHPDSAEARLRLGVNLDRVGKTAQAREILQRLISEPVPEWVKTVAFQEMVRLQLQDGRQDRAVALLRQAVARLPNQTQLAVQLAYLLERQGSASAARQVLAGIKPRPQATDGSPRHRYGQWPTAALDEVRRSLTQQSILRLAALARALGS